MFSWISTYLSRNLIFFQSSQFSALYYLAGFQHSIYEANASISKSIFSKGLPSGLKIIIEIDSRNLFWLDSRGFTNVYCDQLLSSVCRGVSQTFRQLLSKSKMATSGEVSIEMEQIRYLLYLYIHFIISVAWGEQTYLVDAIYFSHYIFHPNNSSKNSTAICFSWLEIQRVSRFIINNK